MTIRTRNILIISAISLSILLVFIFFPAIIYIFLNQEEAIAAVNSADIDSFFPVLIILMVIIAFSTGSSLLLRFFFRKTTSPEIFFFTIFILTLGVEVIRCVQIYILLNNFPVYPGVVLTRIVYFWRFFGIICLFFSGLFATGLQFQRFEIIFGIAGLLSLILTSTMPIDSTILNPDLLYRIGEPSILFFGILAIEILTILSFFLAAARNSSFEYFLTAVGLILVTAGKEMLFGLSGVITTLIGIIFLSIGTFLFSSRIHSVYLWI